MAGISLSTNQYGQILNYNAQNANVDAFRSVTVYNASDSAVVNVYLTGQAIGLPFLSVAGGEAVTLPCQDTQQVTFELTGTNGDGYVSFSATDQQLSASSATVVVQPSTVENVNNFAPVNNNTPTNNFSPTNNSYPTNNFSPTNNNNPVNNFNPTNNINAFGSSSYASSGYTTFPNSFIFQWGNISEVGHDAGFTIIWPKAYASAIYSLTFTVLGGSNLDIVTANIATIGLTGCTGNLCGGYSGGTYTLNYLTIGV